MQDTKREKSLQDTVQTALRQITEKKYAVGLMSKGIKKERIRIYGIAFHGKQVLVDGGMLSEL